jgi:hypothetical protein
MKHRTANIIMWGVFSLCAFGLYSAASCEHRVELEAAKVISARESECSSKDGVYFPLEGACLSIPRIRLGQDTSKVLVVVYGASYCEACDRATDYLAKRHIANIEYDVSKDVKASFAMEKVLDEHNLDHGLIPVIVVEGGGLPDKVLLGFVESSLNEEVEARSTYKD